ncbi:MAG: hypothetical protein DMG15_00520 [Acidobacteria bacterium]|nr:MAG: hypothetical protein DMG15_00520 [Acidobacteriota bacterium]
MRSAFMLLSLVSCSLFSVSAWAELQAGTQSQGGGRPATTRREERQRKEVQPGATQGAILTDVTDAQPKFNMDYFVGEWTFESNMSESPLGAGGPTSGSETIRNVLDGRFWDISIKGEGPEGPFTGKGIITYQDSFAGQSYMRYEITRGIALLKSGNLGCDLGGTCSLYFETPPFEHNGSRIQLKGRYYLTSPFSYRVTTEIAVDKGEYRNWGTTWYTKNEKAKPAAIK